MSIILSILGIGAAIAGLIAIGAFIVWVVRFTIKAFRERARKKLEVEKAKKVVCAELKTLAREGDAVTLDELDKMADEYSHVVATVSEDGEIIGDVELVQDENSETDSGIKKLLGSKGFVVVER